MERVSGWWQGLRHPWTLKVLQERYPERFMDGQRVQVFSRDLSRGIKIMKDYEPHEGSLALLGFVHVAEWYTGRDTCTLQETSYLDVIQLYYC